METDFVNMTYKSKMSNFDWYMEVSVIALLMSMILVHFAWWHMKNVMRKSHEEEEISLYQDEVYTKDRKESFPFLQHMAKQSMYYVFPMLGDAGESPQLSSDDETKPMIGKSPSVDGFFIGDHPNDSNSDAPSISDDYLNVQDLKKQFHDPLTRVSSAPPNNLLY
ncbi:Oidioi.mRNA.OKI2018_I69.PAR.g9266.t1.cds [Oikopleura dioica]|uniref:Oidioi.mRNA.OKI2018_I69.PAR.g9266.t1.cds n=1 Tax=Oikopleura dioica TaxID=34765 RepID=A0ABN7RJU0_OIKDI|nr:Oidioi.mRNA.OKI2018_I69.PAR.g9266.t1.cds [Oikopleura dioica]